jgi:thymidylate synthase (FAD)
MSEDMFTPSLETIKPQSTDNKQGRGGNFDDSDKAQISYRIDENNAHDQAEYQFLLKTGLAKEMARGVLSVNNYTEWYWKINLHNLFHFLKLRMDAHAQYEIRVFAEAMYELIKPIVPIACEAFEDYIFDPTRQTYQSYKISKHELYAIKDIIAHAIDQGADLTQLYEELKERGMSQREIAEFNIKFGLT